MTRPTPRLLPGPHVALLSADGRTVVVPGAEEAVGPLWAALAEPAEPSAGLVDRLLDVVLSAGLRGRSGFAIVHDGPEAVRVAVRGIWSAIGADPESPMRSGSDTGWREARLPAGAPLLLTSSPSVAQTAAEVGWIEAPPGPLAVRVQGLELPALAVPLHLAPVLAAPASVIGSDAVPSATHPDPLTVPLAALLGGAEHGSVETDPAPAPVATIPVLRLSAGEVGEIALDRPVVIGRAPRALGPDPDEDVRLVAVPSPHHEISSTHLEIRPGVLDPLVPTVTDLGSTNGTLVIRPGRPPETLRPGVPAAVTPGAVVDLGDGLTIELGVGA